GEGVVWVRGGMGGGVRRGGRGGVVSAIAKLGPELVIPRREMSRLASVPWKVTVYGPPAAPVTNTFPTPMVGRFSSSVWTDPGPPEVGALNARGTVVAPR